MKASARDGLVSMVLVLALPVAGASLLGVGGCRKMSLADQDQAGDAVGELMASIDESTKGSGATARIPILRMPEELKGPVWHRMYDGFSHIAYAARSEER